MDGQWRNIFEWHFGNGKLKYLDKLMFLCESVFYLLYFHKMPCTRVVLWWTLNFNDSFFFITQDHGISSHIGFKYMIIWQDSATVIQTLTFKRQILTVLFTCYHDQLIHYIRYTVICISYLNAILTSYLFEILSSELASPSLWQSLLNTF